MKTYAESLRIRKFDWNKNLKLGLAGKLTEDQRYGLITKAANWTTCACGNQCRIIPRDLHGAPIDIELRTLGSAFYNRVSVSDFGNAIDILRDIEHRADVVIRELYQSLNKPIPTE